MNDQDLFEHPAPAVVAEPTVHYSWREKVRIDGRTRYIHPNADPMQYETVIDFIFYTPAAAVEWREEWMADENESSSDPATWLLFEVREAAIPADIVDRHVAAARA